VSGRETVTTPLGLGPLSLGVADARRIALLGVLVSLVEDGEDVYLGDDGVASSAIEWRALLSLWARSLARRSGDPPPYRGNSEVQYP
jgi:hypothetical protein